MTFNPDEVNLHNASKEDVLCFYAISENDYNGHMGARISSIFVILFVSTAFTFFPVLAKQMPRWKIPYAVYIFARYFGTGVITATAFVHLLDPAYKRIGPKTCVGESGYWGEYSWCAAIVLGSIMFIFLLDLVAEVYVERKFGVCRDEGATEVFVTHGSAHDHKQHPEDGSKQNIPSSPRQPTISSEDFEKQSFRQQIAAFLILEFGIIFHSVIIGLNLGVTGSEFATLYPVLVFHQSFEGLGIGARLSAIPCSKEWKWLPWALCMLYGLTTPISIAIGLGVRTTYNPNSKVALIVQGFLNAVSAGVLIYSALVELLARDFIFDPDRTKKRSQLAYMVFCMLLGAGIMALIGKWA